MQNVIANRQHVFDLAKSPNLLTGITTALLPTLRAVPLIALSF